MLSLTLDVWCQQARETAVIGGGRAQWGPEDQWKRKLVLKTAMFSLVSLSILSALMTPT